MPTIREEGDYALKAQTSHQRIYLYQGKSPLALEEDLILFHLLAWSDQARSFQWENKGAFVPLILSAARIFYSKNPRAVREDEMIQFLSADSISVAKVITPLWRSAETLERLDVWA